jgi:diguanylate cyclase (GGDEF)-like protein
MLMRVPFSEGDVGRNVTSTGVLKRAQTAYAGDFEGMAASDGVSRLFSFRRVGVFPLILTVGTSTAQIYAGWRQEAWSIGAVVLILAGATIGLALFAARELRKRTAVEADLALMATTDSLTGLSNRRSFDDALAREWQRAVRDRSPISLLMIDADHFKAYNDRYGHQAGDDALAAIAVSISASTRSVPDMAARYGGEEFAILLPGASSDEAAYVADRVHESLSGLMTSTSGGPPIPTVSIGVASCETTASCAPADLVTRADRALYEAKRNGRNCTKVHSAPSVAIANAKSAA